MATPTSVEVVAARRREPTRAAEQSRSESGERCRSREQHRRQGDRHGAQDLQRTPGSLLACAPSSTCSSDHPGADRERKRQCEPERANESPEDSAFSAATLDAPLAPQDESTHCFVPSLFFGTTMLVPWAWSKPLVPGGALPTWIRWTRTKLIAVAHAQDEVVAVPRNDVVQGEVEARAGREHAALVRAADRARTRARCAQTRAGSPRPSRPRPCRWSSSSRCDTCSCEERASIRPEMPCVMPPSCWFVRPGATCASTTLSAPKLVGAASPIAKIALCFNVPAEAGCAARRRASAGSATLRTRRARPQRRRSQRATRVLRHGGAVRGRRRS